MVKKTYHITCGNCSHKFDKENQENMVCPECKNKVSLGWKIEVSRKSDIDEYKLAYRLMEYFDTSFGWCGFEFGELQEHDRYDPEKPYIMVGDWNNGKLPKHFYQWIEDRFTIFEIMFNDEYAKCSCGHCNTWFRTTSDSYDWQPNFIDCGTQGYVS